MNSVKALGGANVDVRLLETTLILLQESSKTREREKMAMIHPFDDRDVISGQGMYCSFYNLPPITNQTTQHFRYNRCGDC